MTTTLRHSGKFARLATDAAAMWHALLLVSISVVLYSPSLELRYTQSRALRSQELPQCRRYFLAKPPLLMARA